jgi:hypothetical protein
LPYFKESFHYCSDILHLKYKHYLNKQQPKQLDPQNIFYNMNHDYDFLVVLKEKIGCDGTIVIELASQLSKT